MSEGSIDAIPVNWLVDGLNAHLNGLVIVDNCIVTTISLIYSFVALNGFKYS
jgi:hypothetical protein